MFFAFRPVTDIYTSETRSFSSRHLSCPCFYYDQDEQVWFDGVEFPMTLADALTAPIWVIATVIIKSLIVLPFTSKKDKIINARNLIALIPALIVTCVGYYLADRILFGAWGAFAAVIPNVIQVAANAAIYVIFGLALDAAGFKKKVLK